MKIKMLQIFRHRQFAFDGAIEDFFTKVEKSNFFILKKSNWIDSYKRAEFSIACNVSWFSRSHMPLTFIGEILGPSRKTEISIGVNWNWLFYFSIIFLLFSWLLILYNSETGLSILMFGLIIIGYFFIRILLTYHYYLSIFIEILDLEERGYLD